MSNDLDEDGRCSQRYCLLGALDDIRRIVRLHDCEVAQLRTQCSRCHSGKSDVERQDRDYLDLLRRVAMAWVVGRAVEEVRVVDGLTVDDVAVHKKRYAADIAHEEQ